jgi:hypothetical protein
MTDTSWTIVIVVILLSVCVAMDLVSDWWSARKEHRCKDAKCKCGE